MQKLFYNANVNLAYNDTIPVELTHEALLDGIISEIEVIARINTAFDGNAPLLLTTTFNQDDWNEELDATDTLENPLRGDEATTDRARAYHIRENSLVVIPIQGQSGEVVSARRQCNQRVSAGDKLKFNVDLVAIDATSIGGTGGVADVYVIAKEEVFC